jgi:hypothetical protein
MQLSVKIKHHSIHCTGMYGWQHQPWHTHQRCCSLDRSAVSYVLLLTESLLLAGASR